MIHPLLTSRISSATLVNLRDRSRQVAEAFGLDTLQTTRLITAVSEIARNTVQYAKEGTASFGFRDSDDPHQPQHLVIVLADKGPGIANLQAALAGQTERRGYVPMGLGAARRLVDVLHVESEPGKGTQVRLEMAIPRLAGRIQVSALAGMADELARQKPPTPLEELERQNREMVTTLEALRLRQVELQRADERKNQFLATLAHELRSPLGTLQMMLEIIGRTPQMTPEELQRRREVMLRQTDQLTGLVSELMDASRVSQGKVELARVPVELNVLVDQAVEMSAAAVEGKRHTLSVEHEAGDLWAQGDATRLKQVFCNLVQNAARYTQAGGNIRVRVKRAGARARIEVEDDGMGIEPDMLSQVFELFVQGSPGTAEGRSGLGIGLTLVRRLVEEHGGSVTATSAGRGQGSLFVVELPLENT